MKIVDVRTHLLIGPCTFDPDLPRARRVRGAAFVEILCDGGKRGLGETYAGYFWCREGVGASVINGIEAALWDPRGKLEGKPVVELLGGCRHERLPAYASEGPSIPPSNGEDMRSLSLLQIASARYAQLVGLDLTGRGVRACNAFRVFGVPIAEWIIAMMDNILRDHASVSGFWTSLSRTWSDCGEESPY